MNDPMSMWLWAGPEPVSSVKVIGPAAKRIREKLIQRETSQNAISVEEAERQYNEAIQKQRAVAAKRCAERNFFNLHFGSCLRCAHSGMSCDYSPTPERTQRYGHRYRAGQCRRCERAGAKFCIMQGSYSHDNLVQEQVIILINGSDPTKLGLTEEDLEEIDAAVDEYTGKNTFQLQPGIWMAEPDIKRLPIPSFRTAQHDGVIKSWKDVLPDPRNLSNESCEAHVAQVLMLEIYESIQGEKKKAAALRRGMSSQEENIIGRTQVKEGMSEQKDQELPEMFKGVHSTDLIKLHVPRLCYKQRQLHVSEHPKFKHSWLKS
ncbi:hypothetical protein PFICI_11837 [Pestalotiopsis fici W106-1]|uniref:Uncharacterized protein n=1 Tax=Pestalotiopsis fici (strain W106-1 / CGMCC3.15140) TaxID=1229662 RepID=W3WRF5_PESFW|nr:uncharacterized protein PFICI_11837 [Pestalotiopsis fici W106-1]ETS76450.1 hypothetical protein PFICI_11837 [Pestalotiopsis fici W106-1]